MWFWFFIYFGEADINFLLKAEALEVKHMLEAGVNTTSVVVRTFDVTLLVDPQSLHQTPSTENQIEKRGQVNYEMTSVRERSGNERFISKDFEGAIEMYTRALGIRPDNPRVLSNRAQAYIQLKRYELALRDTEVALQVSDGDDRKVLFRRAKAFYGLKRYEAASSVLENLQRNRNTRVSQLPLVPTAEEVEEFVQSVNHRLEEKLNGGYDLNKMLEAAQATSTPSLDHADYIGPVRVAGVQENRKGLVATRELVAGTLLLCTKAYAIIFSEDLKPEMPLNFISICAKVLGVSLEEDLKTEMGSSSKSAVDHLILKVQEKLKSEPHAAEEFYSHYAVANMPRDERSEQSKETENRQVDRRLIGQIVRRYCLQEQFQFPMGRHKIAAGLWILPSLINHSCLGNARYYSIGDFMFVRAITDIAEGEEVLVSYVEPLDSFEDRTSMLWMRGIICKCSLCSFARERPAVVRLRNSLSRAFEAIAPRVKMGRPLLPQLHRIIAELRGSAGDSVTDEEKFPLELVEPLLAVSYLHLNTGRINDAVQVLLELLEHIPRCGGRSNIARTDISCQLSAIYNKMSKPSESRKWKEKAREEFNLMNGDEDNLWESYLADTAAMTAQNFVKF
ncbi:hypothetical protein R1sor_024633 [Riccia sorocarpa]|uniref:SET domain-containing protein n=1 Tax=Riccia sorocarpa TaxID=122646 RepID=A0ABD3GR22_9MARC